ncbi:hypothetical protein LWI29_010186 [Acer saccharum]|uniref:Uncharacterized protein n=1 Tax=Acer saccharum TaxID=4024 RepID=A0AA39SHH7_ACESA|nr:hypothetical protein LWI29_010186 [Acer saccharum]
MKGLFKTKPKTPTELVISTRELLTYTDKTTEIRERKREEKARRDVTNIMANLQRQRVNSRLIACKYLEDNLDLMDILISGYEDSDIALTYGTISRECIRHQSVAKYVLNSGHMKKFFIYLQNPNFDIASDVQATFKVEWRC